MLDLRQLAFGFLWLFIFSMPWEAEVIVREDLPLSHMIAGAAGITALLACIATGSIRRLSSLQYVAAAFVVWAALSYGWSLAHELTALRVASYVQLLIMMWLIWEFADTAERQERLLSAYVLGAWVGAASTIYAFIADSGAGMASEVRRYTAGGEDDNEMGIIIALGMAIACHLLACSKRWRVFWLASVPMFLLAILLTGSRGAFLASMVPLILFPASLGRLQPVWRNAGILLLTATAVIATAVLPDSLWERVRSIPAEVTEGTLTKRTYIWQAGFDAYRDHSFIGVGAGAFEASVYKSLDIAYVAHNSYLSVLVELGIVGSLLFGALLIGLFCIAITLPPPHRRGWIVLLMTWGVAVSSVTWEHRKPTWFLFGMVIAQASAMKEISTRKAGLPSGPRVRALQLN